MPLVARTRAYAAGCAGTRSCRWSQIASGLGRVLEPDVALARLRVSSGGSRRPRHVVESPFIDVPWDPGRVSCDLVEHPVELLGDRGGVGADGLVSESLRGGGVQDDRGAVVPGMPAEVRRCVVVEEHLTPMVAGVGGDRPEDRQGAGCTATPSSLSEVGHLRPGSQGCTQRQSL
jgi:hypothetical protein